MNSIVTSAIGEKIAALKGIDWLKKRADRGDRRAFGAVLVRVPYLPPVCGAGLGPRASRRTPPSARTR